MSGAVFAVILGAIYGALACLVGTMFCEDLADLPKAPWRRD